MVTLDVELYMFCVALVTGAALGLCGDAYRAVRDAWPLRGLAAVVCDLAFAIVAAVVLALGLVLGSWGALRLAVVAGVAAGVALYAGLASPFVYGGVRVGLAHLRAAVTRVQAALARWRAVAGARSVWTWLAARLRSHRPPA